MQKAPPKSTSTLSRASSASSQDERKRTSHASISALLRGKFVNARTLPAKARAWWLKSMMRSTSVRRSHWEHTGCTGKSTGSARAQGP